MAQEYIPNTEGGKEMTFNFSQMVWRSPRAIVACGVLGATLFATNLVIGGMLIYATGIPGLSAAVSGLFVPFVLSLSSLVINRPGASTVVWIVYSILAIPTVLNGPPGLYKVIIGVMAGIAYDLPITLVKGRLFGHYLGLVSYTVVNLSAFWFAFDLLDLPGAEAFRKAVFIVAALFFIEGIFSVTLAHLWYHRRLNKLPFIQRLRRG